MGREGEMNLARRGRRGNIIIEQNSQRTKNKPTVKVKQSGKGKHHAKLQPLPPSAEDPLLLGLKHFLPALSCRERMWGLSTRNSDGLWTGFTLKLFTRSRETKNNLISEWALWGACHCFYPPFHPGKHWVPFTFLHGKLSSEKDPYRTAVLYHPGWPHLLHKSTEYVQIV